MVPIDLSDSYLKSRECGDTRRECDRIIEGLEKNERGVRVKGIRGKYATNFFWQVRGEREREREEERERERERGRGRGRGGREGGEGEREWEGGRGVEEETV